MIELQLQLKLTLLRGDIVQVQSANKKYDTMVRQSFYWLSLEFVLAEVRSLTDTFFASGVVALAATNECESCSLAAYQRWK